MVMARVFGCGLTQFSIKKRASSGDGLIFRWSKLYKNLAAIWVYLHCIVHVKDRSSLRRETSRTCVVGLAVISNMDEICSNNAMKNWIELTEWSFTVSSCLWSRVAKRGWTLHNDSFSKLGSTKASENSVSKVFSACITRGVSSR